MINKLRNVVTNKIEEGIKELESIKMSSDKYAIVMNNIFKSLDFINDNGKAQDSPIDLKVGDKFEEVDNGLVVFYSKTCGYCKDLFKVLDPLYKKTNYDLYTFCGECEEGKEIGNKYKVKAYPILVKVENGVVVTIEIGWDTGLSEDKAIEKLSSLMTYPINKGVKN